jgi:hypothetical protein
MSLKASVTGPLVVLEATDVLYDRDLDVLFGAFERARKAGPFVVLTDTVGLKSAPRAVISELASRLKEVPGLEEVWLGDAVVVSSAAVRFVLSTLLVIAPMPTEVKVFSQRMEARHWCAMLLRRHGLMVPELLRSA